MVYSAGDLLCVLPCAILFMYFSVLLALRLSRLGKRELILIDIYIYYYLYNFLIDIYIYIYYLYNFYVVYQISYILYKISDILDKISDL